MKLFQKSRLAHGTDVNFCPDILTFLSTEQKAGDDQMGKRFEPSVPKSHSKSSSTRGSWTVASYCQGGLSSKLNISTYAVVHVNFLKTIQE